MSPLLRDQIDFAKAVSALIAKAFELGYLVTLGDAYRDPRLHGELGVKAGYGSAKSFHKKRLAIDLNLFDGEGNYIQDTSAHEKLGKWWMDTYPEACWGGLFRDGNHYSWGECDGK